MNKFILLTATFGIPLLGFLMLGDLAGTIYRPAAQSELGYQVVEPVEEEIEAEEPVEAGLPEEEPAEQADAGVVAQETDEREEAAASVTELAEDKVADSDAEQAAPAVEVAVLTDDELTAARRAVRKCAACHQIERERNGVGPHLVGVIGRPIGAVEGFKYSDALSELNAEGAVWGQDNLIDWLENPVDFAPGTKMNFKLRDEEDRRLIAGLLAQNGG